MSMPPPSDPGTPRERRGATLLSLLSLGALAAEATLGVTPLAVVPALLAIGAAAVAWRWSPRALALTTLIALVASVWLAGLLWQITAAIALGTYVMLARRVPALAPGPAWCAQGRVPWLATLAVGGVTPIALVGWLLVMRPDLGDVLGAYVPAGAPLPLLIAGAVLFSVVNASLEELIWRGVIQDRLVPLVGVGAAVVLQATSFGMQHAHGVPHGIVGVVLAGTWALMLGALRQRSGGLLAPLIAHIIADAAIAAIVLTLTLRG